jgi:hypothetical protein
VKRKAKIGLYPAAMKINAINRIASLSLFSALALVGCVASGEEEEILVDDDVETSTTEQAVSWTSLQWHSCTSQECTVNLGSSDNRTCVLAGLRGKLSGGISGYPAGANIVNNGSWGYNLYIKNPGYEDISAMTLCIPNTANRTTASWQSSAYATEIAPGPSSTRRCFLSGIYNYNSTGFSGFSSNTKVWRDGNTHFIGGSFPSGSNVRVFATCVDIATNQGTYAYGNGVASSYAGNLTYNPSTGGVACGLTGIGGQFTTNNPGRGVIINYDGGTRYWNWTMSPWTGGNALCVK